MAIIFLGSTDMLSAEQTSRIIGPLLRWFQPDMSAETIAQLQFFVRKGAHVTEYAILGLLLLRAVGTRAPALLLGVGYAITDELHQHFVSGRHASPVDVAIDSAGLLIGVLVGARALFPSRDAA